jgi:iron complex outermembrane receptor protein
VEVLKGPQGTIFGRNTEGGALSITLRKPDDELRGKVAASIDNFATARLQGQVSGPITKNFFVGLAIDASRTDGYLKDPTLGNISADHNRKFAGRLALRWKPTDRLDINLSVDGSNTRGPDGLPGIPRGDTKYEVLSNFLPDEVYTSIGGSLNIAYDLDNVQVTSISSVRKLTSYTPYDFSGGPVGGVNYPNELSDLYIDQTIISQELRVNGVSLDKRLHWLAGAYLFREENDLLRRLSLPYLPAFGTSYDSYKQDQLLTDRGFAFFADGTFEIMKSLSVDLGLRYGSEKTKSNFYQYAVIPDIITINSGVLASIKSNYLTPSASILYHITPDATIYVRYAKGERAGGFPLAPTPSSDIAFKPEKTDNFEVGTKGRLIGGALGYDLSAFYIKLTNQQVTSIAFVDGNPNIPVSTTTNAGKSSSRGFEANFNLNPTRRLALTANFGYTDAHYDYYIDTVGNNRAGQKFPFVPPFTAAGTAAYTIGLPQDRSLTLTGEYQHVGPILSGSGVDIDLQFHVKAYDLVNLRARVDLSPRLKFDVFVKNLLDKFIETRVFNTFFFGVPRPFSTVLPPRNVGARLTYSF